MAVVAIAFQWIPQADDSPEGPLPGDQAYYVVTALDESGNPAGVATTQAIVATWQSYHDATVLIIQFRAIGPRTGEDLDVVLQLEPDGTTSTLTHAKESHALRRSVAFDGAGIPCGFGGHRLGCGPLQESGSRATPDGTATVYAGASYELEFLPNLAVPVRMTGDYQSILGPAGPVGGQHRLDLLGFRADATLQGWTPDFPDLVGSARTAPVQEWGPAEGGIEHRFPLSQAYSWATTQAGDSFSSFMARPETYLAEAHGFERVTDLGTAWVWQLIGTSGTQVEERFVQRQDGPVALVDPLALANPSQPTFVSRGEDLDAVPVSPASLYPPQSRLPGELPVVASAQARFVELEPQFVAGAPPEAYGFEIRCQDASCIDVHARVNVGTRTVTESALNGTTVELFLLELDDAGSPTDLQESTQADGTAPQVAPFTSRPGPGDSDLLRWAPTQEQAVGLGLGATLLAALYWAWPALKGFVGGFSRIQEDKLLDHPTRRKVFDLIKASPGIHGAELTRILAVAPGRVRYHVRRLEEGGAIITKRHGHVQCHFLRSGGVSGIDGVLAARSSGAQALLQAIAEHPGAAQAILAQHAGLAISTIHHHLTQLERVGLVLRRRQGHRKVAELTEKGRQRLAELSNQFTSSSYSLDRSLPS